MNIKINYGTGVTTLPTAALESLDRATKADIKLLFLLCSEPQLLAGESLDACIDRLAQRIGISAVQVGASLAFWRGAGVMDIEDTAETAPGQTSAPTVEEPTSPPPSSEASPIPAQEIVENPPSSVANSQPAVSVQNITVTRSKTRLLDELPNYSTDELEQFLSEQSDVSNYLDECQAIWGGIFNPRDMTLVISLVNTWGFSWDYVIALLAYANKYFKERDNQGKSLHFVYRMATNYHKEGILTEEALRQKFVEEERMKDFEHRIRVMFGLGERNLTPREKKYFSTWLYEYKYGLDIVEMAYNITVDTKGSPNMSYTNGILKHWYEDGLATVEDISTKRANDQAILDQARESSITPDNAKEIVAGRLASNANKSPTVAVGASDIGIIRRLLNLGNRVLTEGEISAFTKWRAEFGFRYEIIYYAYQITLENRREYSLPFMDAILSKWSAQKLTTMEQIKAYDKGFKEERERARNKTKPPLNAPTENSSFDTGDFFLAAVKRSFGEDFDPSILNQ